MIRSARLSDLDALVALEQRAFDSDRLSRRSFRHLLTKGHAATLVAEAADGALLGYVMVLFNVGTSLARLYSIAVEPSRRRTGTARALVQAAEQRALAEDCVLMRLEVRRDNAASLTLFTALGYREFGRYPDYYEDHMEALRLEKRLRPELTPALLPVPFYQQTLDFTCGPAALMMAMAALEPGLELERRLEIRLWRESTTVFMTSGHGGCGPYGLALAAFRRGFDVELFLSEEGALFVDSVRSEEKKEVIRVVQEDFEAELARLPVPVHYHRLELEAMLEALAAGRVAVVLISSYRIYREKFPHWVVVTGFDEQFIYVHDPFVDSDKGKSEMDCMHMPIARRDFVRMARYGKSGLRAALLIGGGAGG